MESQARGNILLVNDSNGLGTASFWSAGELVVFWEWRGAAIGGLPSREVVSRLLRTARYASSIDTFIFLDQPLRSFFRELLLLAWPSDFKKFRQLVAAGPLANWQNWQGVSRRRSYYLPANWLKSGATLEDHFSLLKNLDHKLDLGTLSMPNNPYSRCCAHPQPTIVDCIAWARDLGLDWERGELGNSSVEGSALIWEQQRKQFRSAPGDWQNWTEDHFHRLWEPRDLWQLFVQGLAVVQVSGLIIRRPALRDRLYHSVHE